MSVEISLITPGFRGRVLLYEGMNQKGLILLNEMIEARDWCIVNNNFKDAQEIESRISTLKKVINPKNNNNG